MLIYLKTLDLILKRLRIYHFDKSNKLSLLTVILQWHFQVSSRFKVKSILEVCVFDSISQWTFSYLKELKSKHQHAHSNWLSYNYQLYYSYHKNKVSTCWSTTLHLFLLDLAPSKNDERCKVFIFVPFQIQDNRVLVCVWLSREDKRSSWQVLHWRNSFPSMHKVNDSKTSFNLLNHTYKHYCYN